MKTKRMLALLLSLVLLLGLIGCTNDEKPGETTAQAGTEDRGDDTTEKEDRAAVEKTARAAAEVLSSGDSAEITKLIFGSYESEEREKMTELLGESGQSGEGILGYIFARTAVKVQAAAETGITYEIEAPDMSGVFEGLADRAETITEEELRDWIADYAEKAPLKTWTAAVPCQMSDGELTVNYRNADFINAITGGLLEAYQKLYQQMLDSVGKE